MNFRIGQGVDIHRFCAGDHVMLGGVRIDHHQSLAAHSDGDVALHALCDAMLGAAALGDIGRRKVGRSHRDRIGRRDHGGLSCDLSCL